MSPRLNLLGETHSSPQRHFPFLATLFSPDGGGIKSPTKGSTLCVTIVVSFSSSGGWYI